MQTIRISPLTKESFAPYGDVIERGAVGAKANQGTASRFNHLTHTINRRTPSEFNLPERLKKPQATENLCIFSVTPTTLPFNIKLLERHKYSTQMFIPMSNAKASYLVIVALNDPTTDKPDFNTLRVFKATSMQGFNYKVGIWHHPMVGLESVIDFVCLVYERRQYQTDDEEDTEEVFFSSSPYKAIEPLAKLLTLESDKDKAEKAEPAPAAPVKAADQKVPAVAVEPAVEKNTAAPASKETEVKKISPGLITMKMIETRGLKMPEGTNLVPGGANGKDVSQLPFAVIEIDKNEVMMRAVETAPSTGVSTWQTKANFDVSRPCDCVVNVYMPGPDRKDVLIGSVTVRPSFIDQKVEEEWVKIAKLGSPADQPAVTGEVKLQFCFRVSKTKHMSIDDFELLKVIGKGSFGKVMQVRKKDTGRVYAMKIIKKQHIVERDEVAHTLAERTVLTKLNHPFIVPLKYSFQSPEKLYLCLAFVNGGELFYHLQQEGRFNEDRAKFYIAELLCSLECLHSFGIIYRDLKPENILLDYTGHIALCDFGLCKLNMKEGNKTNTFCGTPEYLAPEVLIGKGYTKSVDWWTLGILLYEMIGGLPPFYDENTNAMYNKILNDKLVFHDFMSPEVIDLLSKLLDRDGTRRLGAGGAQEIKAHKFFAQVDWRKLMGRQYAPPFRPNVASAMDTSNFDEEFTSEKPTDSLNEGSQLSDAVQQQFQGFTFQQTEAIAGSMTSGSVMGPNALGPGTQAVVGSMMRQPGGMRRQ